MINVKSLFGLAMLPLTLVSCKGDFQVLSTRTSSPANVKIDFKVNKPSKDIRPVRLTEDYYLEMIDLRKITITEDGEELSVSEGGSSSVSRCLDCSINAVHLVLDYSGSVRDQFEVVKSNAIKFIKTLDPKNSKVRVSFFAGEASLFSPKGYGIYLDPVRMTNWLNNASCSDFLNDATSLNLCHSDRATRLNTSIINGISSIDTFFAHEKMNVIPTVVVFTDGRGRDKGVSEQQVRAQVNRFQSKGGLFYTVSMKSDEADKKYFNAIGPNKSFKMSKVHQLSDRLADVLEDVQSLTPLFFTLKVCSATRGQGKTVLDVNSKKYGIKTSVTYDTGDFGGGCDLKDASQWNF